MKTPNDSPALIYQSEHYPERFAARVPSRVRMIETVKAEIPFSKIPPAFSGAVFEAWVNSHGAVCVIHEDGSLLGVKPEEFEVIAWHDAKPVAVVPVHKSV